MDASVKPQRILRLYGISLTKYKPVEDIFDDKIMSKFEDIKVIKPYDKVPILFTSLLTWPKQTNLKCRVCDREFQEVPKFYPSNISTNGNGNIEAGVEGFMCSWPCVRRHMDSVNKTKHELWNAFERIKVIYTIFTGQIVEQIPIAPCKTEREEYGGTWDIEKYINELKKLDPTIEKNNDILLRFVASPTKNGDATGEENTDLRWELLEKKRNDEIIDS